MRSLASGEDITVLLNQVAQGHSESAEKLFEAVYAELRRLAASVMRRERMNHTLQPSALVNEAYLRLAGGRSLPWESRGHFFVAAARIMRRILIDHARARLAAKRTGRQQRLNLEDVTLAAAGEQPEQMIAIDTALNRLSDLDARQCRVVELRFFAGLSVEETAQAMGISEKTVKRDWSMARAWLETQLRPEA